MTPFLADANSRRSAQGRRGSSTEYRLRGAQVEAELAGALGDVAGVAHEGDAAGDAGGEDLGRRPENAVVVGSQDDALAGWRGRADEVGLERAG